MRFFRIQFVLQHRFYSGVPDVVDAARLAEFMDFTKPSSWYPNARKLKRKIICHVGPTNSGKTFSAMQSFLAKSHVNGIYCAPLRLLAIEAYNKLNKDYKIPCALRTGEISAAPLVEDAFVGKEKTSWQDAPVLSCTVEMVNINRVFDVAVIDEIQMMADPQRGWAFTQAFLGLQAKEIYLCGEEAALPLIEAIAKETGDEIEVKHFQRLSPLAIAEKSLDDSLTQIKPGDCLVTFSRRQIFDLKAQVERKTNMKCAVVYGNLPMESRSEQARLFNEPNTEYDVLVASDAIGMGLNLNIRRIIFKTLHKFNGIDLEPVPTNQVKQIAGRAGRFGTRHEGGLLTTLSRHDMKYLQKCMATPNENIKAAGLQPTSDHIVNISYAFPQLSLSEIIVKLVNFVIDLKVVAGILENYPQLAMKDRFQVACAPVKKDDNMLKAAFERFVRALAHQARCPLDVTVPNGKGKPEHVLQIAESVYRCLDLYLWLATHFPDTYLDVKEAMARREACNELVTRTLDAICSVKKAKIKKSSEGSVH